MSTGKRSERLITEPSSSSSDVIAARESAILAPFAMHSAETRGRKYPESSHAYRGAYQRDRDRILHCAAFRRLSLKTQVFAGRIGDYHRTRLTHTLEVSSIARTIARTLRLNEDLVEALALAHDLGHPPFGHSGEDVLNECLKDFGGFNHNAQALRICERLENSYRETPGLNLSYEVLEGQQVRAVKHRTLSALRGDGSSKSPLLEVQVVDVADSIAYDAHDADDALEIGLLVSEDLLQVPLWQEACERVEGRSPGLSDRQRRRVIVHETIDWQVSDVIENTVRVLAKDGINSVDDVRRSPPIVMASQTLLEKKINLERFLFDKVYRHPRVLAEREPAQRALREMFNLLTIEPEKLPAKFRRLAESEGTPRAVGDYLAGMTDRFALEEHRRLTEQ